MLSKLFLNIKINFIKENNYEKDIMFNFIIGIVCT